MKNLTNDLTAQINFLKEVLSISKKMDDAKALLINNSFEYETLSGYTKTIDVDSNRFFSYMSTNTVFGFWLGDIKSFVDTYEICFDKEHESKKELMSAYRFLVSIDKKAKQKDEAVLEYLSKAGL